MAGVAGFISVTARLFWLYIGSQRPEIEEEIRLFIYLPISQRILPTGKISAGEDPFYHGAVEVGRRPRSNEDLQWCKHQLHWNCLRAERKYNSSQLVGK